MVSVHFDDTHLHSLDTLWGLFYPEDAMGRLAQPAICFLLKRSGILSFMIFLSLFIQDVLSVNLVLLLCGLRGKGPMKSHGGNDLV